MKISRAWQKAVVAGLAAAAAFATGMRLRGGHLDDTGEVVDRVVRASTAPIVDSPITNSKANMPMSRMASEVEFNPFAPLKAATPAALGQPKTVAAPKPTLATKVASSPTPSPTPAAPPLPFVAVGSLTGTDVNAGAPLVFLQQQDQTILVVQPGQAIGSTYRVESINSQRIELVYLPLMQRQTLPLAPHP